MLKLARWLLLALVAATPIAFAQTTSTDRLEGLTTSVAVKPPVKAVSTANLTLEGEQTVGGVAVVDGDRVLVKSQSDATENGIYVVNTSDWARAADFDGAFDAVDGTLVVSNADSSIYYRLTTNDPITIGSSSLTFESVSGSVTASSLGLLLYPVSAIELAAGVTVSSIAEPYYFSKRYGAVCNDVADDTDAIQDTIDAASEAGATALIQSGTCLVDALKFDASNFTIAGEGRGSILHASANITAGCGILNSLAGDYAGVGDDTTVNQPLLNTACGVGVITVRTNVAASLENVVIRDIALEGNANAIRGIWATGFTRGSKVENVYANNIDGCALCINGSWSFSIINFHSTGDGTLGTCIGLGQVGFGERSGTEVVNEPTVIGGECKSHANGFIHNFGQGAYVSGLTSELNVTDGFNSQSVAGATWVGNYAEDNGGDNYDLGGTNGSDFFEGCLLAGNHSTNTTGNHFRLDGVRNCRIGPNNISGGRTQVYFIPGTGGGANVLDNDITVPGISSTYISNPTELNTTTNDVHQGSRVKFRNTQNGNYTFTIQDAAQFVYKASGGNGETWTIDSNANYGTTNPMAIGTVIEGCNNGSGTLTIAITSDTLNSYDETPGSEAMQTGNALLPDNACFRLFKIDTTEWVLRSDGVT